MHRVRAAQYLRMSTDLQKYSVDNQRTVLAAYAAAHDIDIVETYIDLGKSGVSIRGRKGLSSLLSDVVAGSASYSQVLVYDVSRWGRFQDPDQAAHYEFICRDAGITVRYCSETFDADSSPTASIMKHIKRVMAGEFSRELSAKSRQVQIINAQRGFRQGGSPTYGVRRQLVNYDGVPIRILEPGERKAVESDRVVMVPGLPEELAVLRKIFQWYAIDWHFLPEIARRLNGAGILGARGGKWTVPRLRYLIQNEIYQGIYVFNRTRMPFGAVILKNPQEEWVRVKVFDPIVSPRLFKAAAARLKAGANLRLRDAAMLERLKPLIKDGRLTRRDIDRAPGIPTSMTYSRRFGGFDRVRELVGASGRRRFCLYDDGRRTSAAFLVAGLKRLLATNGYLTGDMITAAPDLPSVRVYQERFGSLTQAYLAAGWASTRSEIQVLMHERRRAAKAERSEATAMNASDPAVA